MNLADELRKLAVMKEEGNLTEQEFSCAKQKLLGSESGVLPPESKETGEKPDGRGDGDEKSGGDKRRREVETYWSSRWSATNLIFRDSIVLAGDGILFRKRNLFGSKEELINYRAVASVRTIHGLLLSTLSIETNGGSQPIFINGIWNSEARRIQDSIRAHQQNA